MKILQTTLYRSSTLIFLSGYITPYVMESVLGTSGGYLLMSTLMMALMATGSGEVMSVSSILVYDIYKTHINPFRYTKVCYISGMIAPNLTFH